MAKKKNWFSKDKSEPSVNADAKPEKVGILHRPISELFSSKAKPAESAETAAVEAASAVEAPAAAQETQAVAPAPLEASPAPAPVAPPAQDASAPTFFDRMKKGLTKTRTGLVDGVTTLFIGKKEIDDDLMEELETQLILADIGIDATRVIIDGLMNRIEYKELEDADALFSALKVELRKVLEPANVPLVIDSSKSPFVIFVVGVNGVGKTTTIGKLAKRLQNEGKSVMLAAGDTFRAAAVEQLQVWGERNDIPVVAQHTGADSASVCFDALQAAKARGIDVLIADTAGRLHNKDHLMEELRKVKRVMGKLDDDAPHEVLLVVDAGTGQNALNQAESFNRTVQLNGMVLTKLDGTAKGGVVFAMAQKMKLPIRFIGVGEQIDDLRPFVADEFIDALFDMDKLQN